MLTVTNYSVTFDRYLSGLKKETVTAVNGLDLTLSKGEIVSVVGASGSGKSILAEAMLGLLPKNAQTNGDIYFNGESLTPKRSAELRGKTIALIPQSVSSLDPLMPVGRQVARSSLLNGSSVYDARATVKNTFQYFGLPTGTDKRFPFQLSGGMTRRVLLSSAVVTQAELLIADEPTPGLHKDSVRQVLTNLRALADSGKGVLLITHDLDEAIRVSDTIVVVYKGKTVEIVPASCFGKSQFMAYHPYSKALWESLPQNNFTPLPLAETVKTAGCTFVNQCPVSVTGCQTKPPRLIKSGEGRVRCHHVNC